MPDFALPSRRFLLSLLPILVFALCPMLTAETPDSPGGTVPEKILAASEALAGKDFDRAASLIAECVDEGLPYARLLDAFRREFGIGIEMDTSESIAAAEASGQDRDWEAARFLAWKYMNVPEEDLDLKKVEDWRSKAKQWKESHPHPQLIPESLLKPVRGGLEPDYRAVGKWNQARALKVDPVARYNMFVMLLEGRGMPPNPTHAFAWLEQAANSRNIKAAKWLSTCYAIGLGVGENEELAADYQLIAAEEGDAEAQHTMALNYQRGRGVPRDPQKAVEWYRKSADQDYLEALKDLGELYYDGELVEENNEEAYRLYSRARELGDLYARYKIAWMTFYGQGIASDPERGVQLFQDASDSGSKYAPYALSQIYLDGKRGVKEDPQAAARWAELALERDNSWGHKTLARLALRQEGGPDYEEAFYHYEELARDGDEDAQYELGEMLLQAHGIGRDLEESYNWFRLAADKGQEDALMRKLLMEALGWGTEKNVDSFIRYLELRNGDQKLNSDFVQYMRTYAENDYRQSTPSVDDNLASLITGKSTSIEPVPDEAAWRDQMEGLKKEAPESRQPSLFYGPPPEYPTIMRMLGLEDRVTALLIIDEEGRVRETDFEGSPLPPFAESVRMAMPTWRFIPAFKDGEPAESRIRIPIPFSYNN